MSNFSRRRRLFASFRRVASRSAFLSLLCALLVGIVGCAGGSNPFCCNSKEKSQIDQNLERAQSLDENAKETTPDEKNVDEKEEDAPKTTIHANILQSDGSGNAPQVAEVAQPTPVSPPKTIAQEMPVTALASDAAAENASSAERPGLLQAPVLPPLVQTPQVAQPTPADVAAPVESSTKETPTPEPEPNAASGTAAQTNAASENAVQSNAASGTAVQTNAASENAAQTNNATEDAAQSNAASENAVQSNAASGTAVQTASANGENNDAANRQSAPSEVPTQDINAEPQASKEESQAGETPVDAPRTTRRNGPQRAATRQVARRVSSSSQTLVVPQTRGVATNLAPTPNVVPTANGAPALLFRTQAVVPGVDESESAAPSRVSPPFASAPASAFAPVVTFRTRTVVP